MEVGKTNNRSDSQGGTVRGHTRHKQVRGAILGPMILSRSLGLHFPTNPSVSKSVKEYLSLCCLGWNHRWTKDFPILVLR